jgi:hypothetical protein
MHDAETMRYLEARLVVDRPEQLVLRVDRTDPSKNVVRGFLAYDRLLEKHPNPTPEQAKHGLDGNICRCGTYNRIRRAIHRAAVGSVVPG